MESDVTQSALFYKLWAWGETHKKHLIGVAVAIVVVAVGIIFWFTHQSQQQTDANDSLSKLLVRNAPGTEVTPDALLRVAGEYPSTDAGQRAALLAATDMFAEGRYDEARGQFEKFLGEHGDSTFAGAAALGVAACLDAQGRTDEAINKYRDVADRYQGSVVVAQAKLALARLYAAQGKFQDAFGNLEEIARSYPGQMGAQANREIHDLLTEHPELNPANRAPAPAPTAPVMVPTNRPGAVPLMLSTSRPPANSPIVLPPPASNKQ